MKSKSQHLQLLKTYLNLLLFKAGNLLLPSRRSYLINADNARSLQISTDWLVNYIGQPHEQLGRSGDICPFVRTALKRDKMDFLVFPGITELTQRTLSNILLSEGLKLLKQLNPSDKEMELTTTNILFPNLPKEKARVLHDAHTYCKSFLMSRGVMLAVFFEGYDKKAIYNPEFLLYHSPFPIVTLRPMALHDIIFLELNEEGFREYWGRYKHRYYQRQVPEKFDYYERFHNAEKRFGLTP